jgi:hypothetical protein
MTDGEKLAVGVLLFYSGGPWDMSSQQKWRAVMGQDNVNTKALGDLARKIMEAQRVKLEAAESGGRPLQPGETCELCGYRRPGSA